MGACGGKPQDPVNDVVLNREEPAAAPAQAPEAARTSLERIQQQQPAAVEGSSSAGSLKHHRPSLASSFMTEHLASEARLSDEYDRRDCVTLGRGMSGKVTTVRHLKTGHVYALKALRMDKLNASSMEELRTEKQPHRAIPSSSRWSRRGWTACVWCRRSATTWI